MSNTRIIALAKEMADAFETHARANGDRFDALKDDRPQWMQDVCQEAHGGMLPDDYKYHYIRTALEALTECDEETELSDACDYAEADVYTPDLLRWLASSMHRPDYCDEAARDLGLGSESTIIERIQAGQWSEKREVFALVLRALTAHAEEGDNDAQLAEV